jgi:hypothetical protein
MRKVLIVAVAVSAVLTAGCASKNRGLSRGGPDEFAVARQAPLVIPPDFALVPPTPGAARVQGNDPSRQALDALFGGPAQRSAGEQATLGEAGTNTAEQGIRSAAGDPQTNVVDKGSTTRDIVAAPEGDGQNARAATTSGANAAPAGTATPQ